MPKRRLTSQGAIEDVASLQEPLHARHSARSVYDRDAPPYPIVR
jgi:hypothetical protein